MRFWCKQKTRRKKITLSSRPGKFKCSVLEWFSYPEGITPNSGLTGPNNTYIYIYMCVCVCVCVCVCTHAHTHTYIYIYIYEKWIHAYIYVYIYIYMHVYIYIRTYIYKHINTHLYTYMYVFSCTHIYTHTHTHTHTRIYIHTYISSAVRVFANGPGDLGSIPGRVIPKTLKMELDTTLLNTQHYKVRFKGKVEQSREWSSALPYTLV